MNSSLYEKCLKMAKKVPVNCVIITSMPVSDEKWHEYSLSCTLFYSQSQRQQLMSIVLEFQTGIF